MTNTYAQVLLHGSSAARLLISATLIITRRSVLESELKRPLTDVFSSINEVPLATASVAQVSMCVCNCVCGCMCVYMYACVWVCMCVGWSPVCVYVCMSKCVTIYVLIVCVGVCSYVCVFCMCACMGAYMQACMCVYLCVPLRLQQLIDWACVPLLNVCYFFVVIAERLLKDRFRGFSCRCTRQFFKAVARRL